MVYEKRQQMKVVRTEHHIRVYEGTGTASMMKRALAQVPDGASLNEVVSGESSLTTLIFLEEASCDGDNRED